MIIITCNLFIHSRFFVYCEFLWWIFASLTILNIVYVSTVSRITSVIKCSFLKKVYISERW
jgi:hypothetical protein